MKAKLMFAVVAVSALLAGCQGSRAGSGGGSGGVLDPILSPATEVVIRALPTTRWEYEGLWASTAGTPEGAAACFIVAALMMERDRALGEEMMIRSASPDGNNIANGVPGASFRELMRRMAEQPWIASSYVKGTTPATGYAAAAPYRFVFTRRQQMGGNKTKVFVASTGADSPRPVTVSREEDVYRIWEASSISVGVRPPQTK